MSIRERLRRLVRWPRAFFSALDCSRTFGLAAEMAFWLFLSLIPLAAVGGLVAARLAMNDATILVRTTLTLPHASRELVTKELARVSAWNGGTVGPLAAIVFVWLASSGLHAVFDALELSTQSEARPWWKKRLFAIASCIALSIGAAALMLLATGVDWIGKLVGHELLGHGGSFVRSGSLMAATGARVAAGFVIAVGFVILLYRVGLPPKACGRVPLVPGAVAAVLSQILMGYGYGLYVSKAGDGGAYQAGLAAIGVTMMALYLFSTAILMGAELNVFLGARRTLPLPIDTATLRYRRVHHSHFLPTRKGTAVMNDPKKPDETPKPPSPPIEPGETPPMEAPAKPQTEYEREVPHVGNQPIAGRGGSAEGRGGPSRRGSTPSVH